MSELVEYNNLPVQVPATIAEREGRLISQGAEALVFELPRDGQVVKFRPAKPWRLPELDSMLRTRRTNQESRVMRKLAEAQIGVPNLVHVDAKNGLLFMEYISGQSLKQATWDCEGALTTEVRRLYQQLGNSVARMHGLGVMHGDLTTSNVMIDHDHNLRLIDFGLSTQHATIDDKAVDLYVLERAIGSTHPLEVEVLMSEEVMPAYIAQAKELNENLDFLMKKLEKTRAGGRKRTQLG